MKSLNNLIVVLLFSFLLPSCGAAVIQKSMYKSPTIRVLIKDNQESAFIKGSTQGSKLSFVIDRETKKVTVNNKLVKLPAKLTPKDKFIEINGKKYRGTVEVHVYGRDSQGLMLINELPIELYIVGLINGEISSKWHKEAIMTQAVIARTYAMYQKQRNQDEPYHLKSSTANQVYIGADREDLPSYRAVKATYGEVLTYNDELALTVYHSTAGGRTENSEDVWSEPFPYLKSVKSKFDAIAPHYEWKYKVDRKSLSSVLNKNGYKVGEIKRIKISDRTRSKRVKELVIYDKNKKKHKLKGEDLRRILGYSNIKSTMFKVKYRSGSFVFYGKGSGHGVGLSQWGAKGMADAGYKYNKILRHYYKGTKLKAVY